jgi:hypothetical protein
VPQRPPGTNGFAIAALVFGILPTFILGFIFGFIALSQTKKTRQAGRGMAIAALILSGIWTVLWAIFIVVVASAVKTVLDTSGSPGFGLHPGDCFNHSTASSNAAVSKVACTDSHDGETVAIIPITQATYPDADTVQEQANEECAPPAKAYLGAAAANPDLSLGYLYPEKGAWNLGNHSIVCFVGGANGPLNTPAVQH